MHHIPRYSVIMPAYNTGAYIAEAIESVLSQSVSDWELIIIDDGSTDNTAHIARGFHDARIRFIQQANQGLQAVRNRGSRESRGAMLRFR